MYLASHALAARLTVCVFFIGGIPAWAHGQEKPSLYVLSVGVDFYLPPVNKLSGCVNDAKGMGKVFEDQAGKRFGQVESIVLTDAKATKQGIVAGLQALEQKGASGDWYVILLSGHGGISRERWNFVAQDGADVPDTILLSIADRLARQNKKVIIIIDACNSGQLRYAANEMLNRYSDPTNGGVVVMISSMAGQLSAALGRFSSFARAVEEGLAGHADYDGDEQITLKELRRFTFNRVYALNLTSRLFPGLTSSYQDSAIDASLSFSENTPLVFGKKPAQPPAMPDEPDVTSPYLPEKTWRLTLPAQGNIPVGAYLLHFDPFGFYRASLERGGKLQVLSSGVYRTKEKSVHLVHHQGTDRLEVVDLGPMGFRFRFHGRDFKLQNITPPTGALLVDVTDRLSQEDPRDRVRTTSPHKVHVVELQAGNTYIIDMQSPFLDSLLRVEDAEGRQLAEDDDGGGRPNARLTFRPTQSGRYRVITTTFAGGSGLYHLHVAHAVRPPDTTVTAPPATKPPMTTLQPPPRRSSLLELVKPMAEPIEFASGGTVSVSSTLIPSEPKGPGPVQGLRSYALKLEANRSYTAEVTGIGDFQIIVLDPSGATIASQSGLANPRENVELTFRSAQSDTHWIVVSSFLGEVRSERAFRLIVRAQAERHSSERVLP